MERWQLDQGNLGLDGVPLLLGVDGKVTLEARGEGVFLHVRRKAPEARFRVSLGQLASLKRFVACYRYEPFWMRPIAGRELSLLPTDTQMILGELESGRLVLLVPLVLAPFRSSLEGHAEGLSAMVETGDPLTRGTEALLAYLGVGDDPYTLLDQAAEAVANRLGTTTLRKDKPLPDFVDDFGWCTWDAFYQEVSEDKLREGLESFRQGGVEPRFLILDDGWQAVETSHTGEKRLVGWGTDHAKFPGGLRPTVELAKASYRIRTFLVWHAVHGYWGGIDGDVFNEYGVDTVLRWYSPEILRHTPALNWDWWGPCVGRPAPEDLERFYHNYHRHLADQGVDGVKVDNQASVEGLGYGIGGRVVAMAKTRQALEQSVEQHFGGRLINCMACSNDAFYHLQASTLMRTSTDFWPKLPASHGAHVYTNAMVSLWFGEFAHPDWDMFQSGHLAGAYHAAARAVSGSAVYVSDRPDGHDFGVLRQLVLSDGSVPRALGIALPTRDCLFSNPLVEPVLFKVFNSNRGSAVVGLFNARYEEKDNLLRGGVSALDVPGLMGDDFALYLGQTGRLGRVRRDEVVPVSLDTLGWEIATLVPIQHGLAPIGLVDKLNPGGTVGEQQWTDSSCRVKLRDGGDFLAFAERRPDQVLVDGEEVSFGYAEPRLSVKIAKVGQCWVEIVSGK
jgi:raffinose synthase